MNEDFNYGTLVTEAAQEQDTKMILKVKNSTRNQLVYELPLYTT